MNLGQAITYPFRKDCIVSTLVVPAALTSLGSIIWVVPPLIAFYTMMPRIMMALQLPEDQAAQQISMMFTNSISTLIGSVVAGLILTMLIMLPIYGYYWELIYRLQVLGPNAQAPRWKGSFGTYFKSGFHFFLASIVMFIPFMVAMIPFGALLPFVMAPFFLAAEEKTVGSVIRAFVPGLMLAKDRFIPVLVGFYLGIILLILYSIASSILSITIVAPLLLTAAFSITYVHLLTQQYGLQVPEMPEENFMTEEMNPISTDYGVHQEMSPAAVNDLQALVQQAQNEMPPAQTMAPQETSGEAVMMMPSDDMPSANDSRPVQDLKGIYFHKGQNPWLQRQQ